MASYAFQNSTLIIDDIIITGRASGDDTVVIEKNEDDWTQFIGNDGDPMNILSANESGTITFKLMQNSPENKSLSELRKKKRVEGGSFDCSFNTNTDDGSGVDAVGSTCVIKTKPVRTFGAGQNFVEYTILCGRLTEEVL